MSPEIERSSFKISPGWLVIIGVVLWTVLISLLHFTLNSEHHERRTVQMGYMPVITNLAAPILDHVSKNSGSVRFKALKFASFAEMAESLRNGQIEAAFIIAPLSIVLKHQGEDIKIVYIGNRHESTLVTKRELNIKNFAELAGKTVAVPMRFSGHNVTLLRLIEEHGMGSSINIVEMNPPDMAAALATGSLDAYFVGEPFAAQTLKSGDAAVLNYVEDLWSNFICNLVIVRQEFIDKEPQLVKQLVQSAARSGLWAQNNLEEAAEIASSYWNQPVELILHALTKPEERIVFTKFLPREKEIQQLADRMQQVGLINNTDISDLVADSFAASVDPSEVVSLDTILTTLN